MPHRKALSCMHMRGADGAFLPTLFSPLTLSAPNSPDPRHMVQNALNRFTASCSGWGLRIGHARRRDRGRSGASELAAGSRLRVLERG